MMLREKNIKAKKMHTCDACLSRIQAGEDCISWAGIWEGDFYSGYFHPECRDWEVHCNKINGYYGEDWMPLHEHLTEGGRVMLDGAPEIVKLRFPERKSA